MKFWKWLSLTLLLTLVALQIQLWSGLGSLSELASLERQLDRLQADNRALTERNERLFVEVAEFRDGRDSVEEMAREELGMIGANETFYVIVKR